MAKTLKELAFLRDLYIDSEWTQRFTDFADKHLGYKKEERLLYYNAGTGNHVLALRQKLGRKAVVNAFCEDREVLKIATAKGKALQSDVAFSNGDFEDESFDAVMIDASFVRPGALAETIAEAAKFAVEGGNVAFFTVSAGSFGEIFSLLWEVCFNEGIGSEGALASDLITELPTISVVEETARDAGLGAVTSHQQTELFEFKNGKEFVEAPLVANFLMPVWLKTLAANERRRAISKLAGLIDAEDGALTFRFTVKAVLVVGEKI